MAKKFYLALAIGAAAAILISAGPLAADDCEDKDKQAKAEKAESEEVVFADKDRDGKVTRKEAKVDPALERSFNRYDLDENDILDRGEFARLEAEGTQRVAEDHQLVAVAPMEPIEHPDARDERLRPRYVVHQDPR